MQYINDDSTKNNSYINKDFQSLWEELLELIPKLTNKWNPQNANESDPLAVLLKVLAIYSDKLNYNIDKSILERFPQTLTQLRSAHNVYDTLGYKAPWYKSATTENIEISYLTPIPSNEAGQSISSFTIPKWTMISDSDKSIIYTLLQKVVFNNVTAGVNTKLKVQAIQGVCKDYIINGVDRITANNLDSHNRLYFTERNIAQNGIFISQSGGDFDDMADWELVDNIYALSQSGRQTIYEFGIDPISGACYIEFPDNIGNLIGQGLYIKYIVSDGINGNVKKNTLVQFFEDLTVDNLNLQGSVAEEVSTINNYLGVNNPFAITDGTEPATIDEMYENYRRVKNTFETLVTLLDYENFIYQYENALGDNIVSNIRVSDRSNDLYDSYKVRSLNTDNVWSLKSKVVSENGSDNMTAFDLRMFPLNPAKEGVSDVASFNNTFSQSAFTSNVGGEIKSNQSSIESAINSSKTILHNLEENIGTPVFIDYDITGDIYLNHKVSQYEATYEIKPKIDQAIFEKVNSRKLSFGQPISYKDIIDTIQNADDRIDYVALQPINYYHVELNGVQANIGENTVVERAMMSGVTPWANFDNQFAYSMTEENSTVKSNINSINSYIILENIGNALYYKVENNEDFVMFAPQYQDKRVFSNYLYYRYKGNNISANQPYTLQLDENLSFYESRINGDPNVLENASYVLGEGVSIRPSFNLTQTSSSNYYYLTSNNTIAEIGKIENSVFPNTNIQIITNSERLANALGNGNGEEYTLLTSEFLIFRETDAAQYTILGEGNTLYAKNIPISNISASSNIDLLNIITSGDWSESFNGDNLWYRENQILNFGPRYVFNPFYVESGGSEEAVQFDTIKWSGLNNFKVEENTPQDVSHYPYSNGVMYLRYTFLNEGIIDASTQWNYLPPLLENDSWKGFPRLSINLSNNTNYKLLKTQDTKYIGHTQTISYTTNENSTGIITGNNNVQSTVIINSPGGVEIPIKDELNCKLRSFNQKSEIDNNVFTPIHTIDQNSTTLTIPGENGGIAVFNIYTELASSENNLTTAPSIGGVNGYEVRTLAAKSGENVTFAERTYLANVRVTDQNSTYGSSGENLASLFSGENGPNCILLNENSIYDIDYSPTYQGNTYIKDPTQPNAFFNQSHPLNRYALPRLSNHVLLNGNNYEDAYKVSNGTESNAILAGLKINELSINN